MRSAEMSAASRVFSGDSTTISASQLSRTWTSIGAGTARRSSDTVRSHVRGAKFPPRATRKSAYASRSAMSFTISSTSGRAGIAPMTSTCQPGCTPTHVSTRSSAS